MIIVFVRQRRQAAQRNNVNHDQNLERANMRIILRECSPVKFTSKLKFLGDPICSIDILEFNRGDMVFFTPCQHIFHPVCLTVWMNACVNANEKRCPNCNYSFRDIHFKLD